MKKAKRIGPKGWITLSAFFMVAGCLIFAGCGSKTQDKPQQPDDEPAVQSDSDKAGNAASTFHANASDQLLANAQSEFEAGNLDESFELLSKLLIRNPSDDRLLLLASRVASEKGDRTSAIELAESISVDSAEGKAATNLLVREYLSASRHNDAITRLKAAVEAENTDASQAALLRQQLWAIFNRLGRRLEASEQADRLCIDGYLNRPLLISLLRRNDSFPMTIGTGSPTDYFYPGLGMARWHFSQDEFDQAFDQLETEKRSGFRSSAARALYGRLLAERQASPNEMGDWYVTCDEAARRSSDYWVAMGIHFFDQRQMDASARALLEAVLIDPTDDDACHRLARVLAGLGRGEASEAIREHAIRVALIRSLVQKLSLEDSQIELTDDLPEKLITLGRPFEAIGWSLLDLPQESIAKRQALLQQRQLLRGKPEVINMAAEVVRMELDRDDFPIEEAMKQLAGLADQTTADRGGDAEAISSVGEMKLQNVASSVGLEFQWYHAKEIDLSSIPLHEMMGGAIAVLDYDLDGFPDVYFGQGSGDPPSQRSTRSNQLFRNTDADFDEVTAAANVTDKNYSTGIAAGDVNQDGFPDLFVGALGNNRLLINNGDGSFRDATTQLNEASAQFTSSVAIADLTNDSIPELYECVYVEMKDGFRLPDRDEAGEAIVPNPNDFFAEVDRWYMAEGDESFRPQTVARDLIEPGTALGVVITDIDSDGRNDVFVSNDARPNHLLVGFDQPQIRNIAFSLGVAYGFRGFSNACMGIATGDFNRDGRFDMHITNYANEPNNYYLQGRSGVFADFAPRYGIGRLSDPYVGFGIKAVDIDRNGWLDFLVTNGHVYDQSHLGKEFRMPPQLLAYQDDRFNAVPVEDPSGYFGGRYVGRSVAKMDFDRDGDTDFLISHLDEPAALLSNDSRPLGSHLQLQLIGTASERDAVGAHVVVSVDGRDYSDWVTAGDGYLCTDEPILDFGFPMADTVERIEIRWPSGARQEFFNLSPGQRYLVVEGSGRCWRDEHQ